MKHPSEAVEGPAQHPPRIVEPTISVCVLWAFGSCGDPIPGLDDVLEEAGIDTRVLVDARTRIPMSLSNRLLEMQAETVGDPALGVRIGVECAAGAYGMVEQLARSAPDLRESIRVYERYSALIQESVEVRLVEQGPHALVVYHSNEPDLRATRDFVMSYAVTMMRRHVVGGVDIEELRFAGPAPDYRDEYARRLNVAVRFDAPHDTIVMRREDLEKPMSEAREGIHEVLEAKTRRALDRLLQSGCFALRIRGSIRDQLAGGSVSLECAARRLHMSPATLRRRLAEEGTSFREILDSMREAAALRDVLSSNLTQSEIASRLGFAHTTSFYKAFKRWTGLSPAEYRARQEIR